MKRFAPPGFLPREQQAPARIFLQTDNARMFVHLDGVLRCIPDPKTFLNLFSGPLHKACFQRFTGLGEAPYPIGLPLMRDARLVTISSDKLHGVLMTDRMPWAPKQTVLRHVINADQMNEIGFDWLKVQELPTQPTWGVPLAVHTQANLNAAQTLAGYQAIYDHLVLGEELNPYFEYLLARYPGVPGSKYKDHIKGDLIAAQALVNSLPNY